MSGQPVGELDARTVGHHHVRQHHVEGGSTLEQLHGAAPARHGLHEAHVPEAPLERTLNRRLVVDHQDAQLTAGRRAFSALEAHLRLAVVGGCGEGQVDRDPLGRELERATELLHHTAQKLQATGMLLRLHALGTHAEVSRFERDRRAPIALRE